MVNRTFRVELAREARRGVAVLDAQLAPRAVAIGVHRGLRHAQFAGNLLGRKVLVHETQAFALTLREESHRVIGTVVACAHSSRSKRRLGSHVYFNEKG
jgi:hypothetical protein